MIYSNYNKRIMEEQGSNNVNTQNYEACMILAAVGDAMGYKNGSWQFNYSSTLIHKEMMQITYQKGPLYLKLGLDWRYSDDTVMHIATATALSKCKTNEEIYSVCQKIAAEYKKCAGKMAGRAPGKTCMKSLSILDENVSNWNKIPYAGLKGGGCGASMRAACIGLFYHSNLQKLIAVSIESGRITHHNPVGYLGAVVSAYFVYLSLRKVPPKLWVAYLFTEGFPLSKKYVEECGREVKLNLESGQWQKFQEAWVKYAQARNLSLLLEKPSEPKFPQPYGIIEREHFYKSLSWTGWPGALGIDSVLIAYDAFLGSNGSWQKLCLQGILHGGDNDSTGTIAGAWFGSFYGFQGVPKCHTKQLEDNKKLICLAQNIYSLAK